MLKNYLFTGIEDCKSAFLKFRLLKMFAFHSIRSRYSRSKFGPWWITLNMLLTISVLAFIFGNLLNIELISYLPHLAFGFLAWQLISNSLIEGTDSLNASSDSILQVSLPIFTHVIKIHLTNMIIFFHHMILVPLIFLIFPTLFSWKILLFFPGYLLLHFNLIWMSLIFSILAAKFKDFTEIIKNIMQISFYLTPVIWQAELLKLRFDFNILNLNPFYHLINLIREPLVGDIITLNSWLFSIVFLIFGSFLSLLVLGANKKNIAYWV